MTLKKLSTICNVQNGYAFDSKFFSKDSKDMPLVRIRDIKTGKTETYYKGAYSQDFVIHNGDYIIGMDGEFNITEWNGGDALLNQRVCRIIVNSDSVIPRYILYFLPIPLKIIEDETPFVTVKHLSSKKLEDVIVPVPSLSDQRRIVDELDLLSGIIEKKNAQLRTLDELAQSFFAETFENVNAGWQELPFERCIEKVKYTTKLQTKDFLHTGRYPIISQEEDFISGYWDNPADVFRIKKPVVIFGDHTRVLKYVDFDFVLGADGVRILQPIDELDAQYFYYYLKANPVENLGYSRHYKLLKEKIVSLPPLNLQLQFAEKARFISKQRDIIAESVKRTKELLDSRMDKYFNCLCL